MTLDRSGFDRPGPEPEVAAEVPEFSASLELVLLLLEEDDFRRGRFCGRSELDRSLAFNGLSGNKIKQPFENFSVWKIMGRFFFVFPFYPLSSQPDSWPLISVLTTSELKLGYQVGSIIDHLLPLLIKTQRVKPW